MKTRGGIQPHPPTPHMEGPFLVDLLSHNTSMRFFSAPVVKDMRVRIRESASLQTERAGRFAGPGTSLIPHPTLQLWAQCGSVGHMSTKWPSLRKGLKDMRHLKTTHSKNQAFNLCKENHHRPRGLFWLEICKMNRSKTENQH